MKSELIELIEKIKMLPETIQKVDNVFKNPTTTTGDMVKALYSDPLLIARILKLANSPLFGLSRTVTDIAHAVALLGRDVVHTFVVVSIIDEAMDLNISPYGLTKENYLDRAQIQHALGSALASKISVKSLPIVSLGSYLLGLGRVVISRYLIETGQADAFGQAFQEGKNRGELELVYCGARSEDVTATIFNHWKFQPDLIYVIRHANNPSDASDEELQIAAKLLQIANASITLDGKITDESLDAGRALINQYKIKTEVFDTVIEKIRNAS